MNGADALIETLIDNDVTACFANPGTSEMQFVSALDRQPKMRSVLCLFEGVATGAADGYARIAGTPACTLLHLGPGYGNGLANTHNARRAFSPLINVIGDHATYHRQYDAPLNSNIAGIAGPNSLWLKSAESADEVGDLASEAVAAAYGPPPGPVSFVLPADSAWNPTTRRGPKINPPQPAAPNADALEEAIRRLKGAKKPLLLLGELACDEASLAVAGRIAAEGTIRVMTDGFIAKQRRGAGYYLPDRMQYFSEAALADLAGVDVMVLIRTVTPAAFFAYPGKPSLMVPEGCEVLTAAAREEQSVPALEAIAEAFRAPKQPKVQPFQLPDPPAAGALTPAACGQSIGRHLPEGAIISDDSVTSGGAVAVTTRFGRPHDMLSLTGGAIGQGIPAAVGAAVAGGGRKVVSFNGDGAAAYTVQGLWSLARENLNCTVVIFANDVYRILGIELGRTGAGNPGPASSRLLGLGDPSMDWVALAKGFGLPADRCETAEEFDIAFGRAMQETGPRLIMAVIP